ncbi:Na(+)/H(+) antiporter NhaA, partial [Streptomyces sp. NPDC006864]
GPGRAPAPVRGGGVWGAARRAAVRPAGGGGAGGRRPNRLYRELCEAEDVDSDADGIPDIYQGRGAGSPGGPADGGSPAPRG